MYPNGDIVTLRIDKSHGDGENALHLKSGVCGLVVRGSKKSDGNHQYTVDFGAYGNWYAFHNELIGNDNEGWDGDPAPRDRGSVFADILEAGIRPTPPEEDGDTDADNDSDEDPEIRYDDEDDELPLPAMVTDYPNDPVQEAIVDHLTQQEQKEAGFIKLDLEGDIKRRMEAIERGEID